MLRLFVLLLLVSLSSALNWFHHESEPDDSLLQKAKDTASSVKESIQDTASSLKEGIQDASKRATASSSSSSLFRPYNAFAEWWEQGSRAWPHSIANWGQFRTFPNEYVIYLDIPGIPKEELEVRVRGRKLRVRGSHGTCVAGSGEIDRYCLERQVERTFTLPEDVVVDQVDALLKDGMLMIKLPRLQDDEESESEDEAEGGDAGTSSKLLFGVKKLRGKKIGVKDYKPTWRERAREASEAVQHAFVRK
jgi:HSP20 family molecular chaperone IbpA